MSIPEAQLETWSQIGAIQQSAETYETIRSVLVSPRAPYSNRSVLPPFLQGSYKNHTNIRTDSDVDIVITTNEIFYHNMREIPAPRVTPQALQNFDRAYAGPVSYSYEQFKTDVTLWLATNFGADVRPGSKAIFIRGNNGRRDADVLVAAEFRHYFNYTDEGHHSREDGIVFWKNNTTRIVNFPHQHHDNGVTKNRETAEWFKPTVRVFKNMRNRMIADGVLGDGIAPSYYIEGFLANAPNNCFGHSFQRTFEQCMGYLSRVDRDNLMCLNNIHYLVRPNSDVNWPPENFQRYITAVIEYWDNYGRGRGFMGL